MERDLEIKELKSLIEVQQIEIDMLEDKTDQLEKRLADIVYELMREGHLGYDYRTNGICLVSLDLYGSAIARLNKIRGEMKALENNN